MERPGTDNAIDPALGYEMTPAVFDGRPAPNHLCARTVMDRSNPPKQVFRTLAYDNL